MSTALFPVAVLLSAAAALATEIAIVRLGAPYVGQSLIPWSAAITSVLIGLMVGHVLGGSMGGPRATTRRLRTTLGLAWLAGAATALLMRAGAAWLAAHGWFSGEDFWRGPILVAALAWPPGVAAGMVSPLVIRLWSLQAPHDRARIIGRTYAAGAAGSVIGTVIAGLVLLDRIGSAGLAAVIAAVWLALGVAALPWRPIARVAVLAGGLGAAILASGTTPCLIESRYTCVRLFDRTLPSSGLLRFMLLDEGVHSASDRDDPRRLHLGYAALADRLAAAAFATSPSPRAIVIGGGGNTLSRAWSHREPPATVTTFEIDAMVAAAAATRMWAEPSPTLVTKIGDGRVLLRDTDLDVAQVILMDAYRSRGVPPHLVTREFNALVQRRLSRQGLFLSNVIDRGGAPQLAASVARTLTASFPAVDLWVPQDAATGALTNVVVAAWNDAETAVRPAAMSVEATVVPAGQPAKATTTTWHRIDARAIRREWPGLCTLQLTDDHSPVDRLLAGGVRCNISQGNASN
jgi:spermidine synthase